MTDLSGSAATKITGDLSAALRRALAAGDARLVKAIPAPTRRAVGGRGPKRTQTGDHMTNGNKAHVAQG